MPITLSICIPTYNRAKFLGEAIESIICQVTEDIKDYIEIVISDNASNDNTEEVVNYYKLNSKVKIIYYKHIQNMGADNNFLKVIELASGTYCWLLGSDDKVEHGAIKSIIADINSDDSIDIFYVNNYNYDFNFTQKYLAKHSLYGQIKDVIFYDCNDCLQKMGGMFGYISAIIVKKSEWSGVTVSKKFIGSCYIHVFIIYHMLKRGSKVKYISRPCIGWRSGNDSFAENGAYNRLRIDVEGYDNIAKDVFGEKSVIAKNINEIVINQHVFWKIIGAKLNNLNFDFYKRSFKLCYMHYKGYTRFWIKVFPAIITPGVFLRFIRLIYRITLKKRCAINE